MAAIQCRHSQDNLLKFKLSIRTGMKGDLGDFERGVASIPHGLV